MPAHFADSPQMEAIYKMLSVTQPPPAPEVVAKQYRPASVVDKAHIHGRYALHIQYGSPFIYVSINNSLWKDFDTVAVKSGGSQNRNKNSDLYPLSLFNSDPLFNVNTVCRHNNIMLRFS